MSQKCDCGQPLHYPSAFAQSWVDRKIKKLGPTVPITCPEGTWNVPRHYLALHGILASELPKLAKQYGWKKQEAIDKVPTKLKR